MNIALAFTAAEVPAVANSLRWCAELGMPTTHDLFLMPERGLAYAAVQALAEPVFRSVAHVPDYEGVKSDWSTGKQDASGPNSMLRQFAWHFYLNKLGPWLFWESDAIPLAADWVDRLAAEYAACGQPFMGMLVIGQGSAPPHCSGNAIYPQDVIGLAPQMILPSEVAFDMLGAAEVVPRMHDTRLLQHVFCHPAGVVPTFAGEASLALLRADAVLFHRNKDGTLIARLRERMSNSRPQENLSGRSDDGSASVPLARTDHGGHRSVDAAAGSGHCRAGAPPAHTTTPPALGNRSGRPTTAAPPPVSTTEVPIVYTYFAPVPGMDAVEQEWLLAQWRESWTSNGWRPVVLAPEDDHGFARFFSQLPSVNPPAYELACWLRWVALARRGGLLVDYDVLNYGFTPAMLPPATGTRPAILNASGVPCAVTGSARQFEEAVTLFVEKARDCIGTENGQPHVSDMLAVQKLDFETHDLCEEPARCTGHRLVHFAHAACGSGDRRAAIAEYARQRPASALDKSPKAKASQGHDGACPSNTRRDTLRRVPLLRKAPAGPTIRKTPKAKPAAQKPTTRQRSREEAR